jgi:tetratricopeptide (TPR) repeat protein
MVLGAAYAGNKQPAEAVEQYVKAFHDTDSSMEGMFRNSTELAKDLTPEAMLKELEPRLAADPRDKAALFLRSAALHQKGDSAAFIDAVKTLLAMTPAEDRAKRVDRLFLLQRLAVTLTEQKNFTEVIKIYEESLSLNPDDIFALNNLAVLQMDELKDPEAAIPYSTRAAELLPRNPAVLDTLGWNQILLAKYDDGIAAVALGMAISPKFATFPYHLAEGYYRRSTDPNTRNPEGDRRDAIENCRLAHKMVMEAGTDEEHVFEKILVLAEKLGLTLDKNLPVRESATK